MLLSTMYGISIHRHNKYFLHLSQMVVFPVHNRLAFASMQGTWCTAYMHQKVKTIKHLATKWNANHSWSIDYLGFLTTILIHHVTLHADCRHFPSLHFYFWRQPANRRNFPMTRRQSRQRSINFFWNGSLNEAHFFFFFVEASIVLCSELFFF